MTRQLIGAALLVLVMALSGCNSQASSAIQGNTPFKESAKSAGTPAQPSASPSEGAAEPTEQVEEEGAVTTFSVEPVEGWTLLEAASSDTFKSYNLLEPYVGSANFWIRYCGSDVFAGKEEDVQAYLKSEGFSDYEIKAVDKLEYEMTTIRCVADTTINGMNFTLGHYFIDAPGEQDIYFQLSTAPENFDKAQPLWEKVLHTLKTE